MTRNERRRLFDVAASNPEWEHVYCAAIVAANTSMRPVEVKHVRRCDVDLVTRLLHYSHIRIDAKRQALDAARRGAAGHGNGNGTTDAQIITLAPSTYGRPPLYYSVFVTLVLSHGQRVGGHRQIHDCETSLLSAEASDRPDAGSAAAVLSRERLRACTTVS